MFRFVSIVVITVAIAYAAWAGAASAIYGKFAPTRGLNLDPGSVGALINTTERAASAKDQSGFLKIARPHSEQALRRDPLANQALRQLGQYYAQTGNEAKGRQLVELSARLSRRDSTGQLWLAEDGLKNGRTTEALRAIDTVIRTQPETHQATFQALGGLLADPEFRSVFVTYVQNRPPWLKAFVEYNISHQPEALSQTLLQIQPFPKYLLTDQSIGYLLTMLVNRAPIERARDFYARVPGTDRRVLTSLFFAKPADALRFPPFGWELLSDNNVQGFGDVNGDTIAIEALAMPGRRGTAARKLLFLKPGSYRWSGEGDLSNMRDRAVGSVALYCNKGPGEWTPLSWKNLTTGRNMVDFAVASDCPAQMLAIETLGSESQSDASMAVSAMQLIPLRSVASTPTIAN